MTKKIIDEGDMDLVLWRQLLEVDLAEEEATDPGWEDDLDSESRSRVFARLGIGEQNPAAHIIAEFLVDVERWLASTPQTALARDVGAIIGTLEIDLPDLRSAGLGEAVELECDVDSDGRISELAVLIRGSVGGRRLQLVLIDPAGNERNVTVSPYGLALFTGLSIDPLQAHNLRFKLRG